MKKPLKNVFSYRLSLRVILVKILIRDNLLQDVGRNKVFGRFIVFTFYSYRSPPREGAYVHGLFLEGASWDLENSILVDSRMKELHPTMPVMFIKVCILHRYLSCHLFYCY